MDDFDFGQACALIINQQAQRRQQTQAEWEKWVPIILREEIHSADIMDAILGSRSPLVVQRRICRRLWQRFFQDEPPWKEYDTVSFDEGNQMTPYTLRKVLEVSRHSIRVAMRILAKNSFDAEATELLSRPPRLISPLHEDEADNSESSNVNEADRLSIKREDEEPSSAEQIRVQTNILPLTSNHSRFEADTTS